MKIIKLKEKDLKEAGIPFTPGTLYKWHCIGKHPELFVKIGRKLCINLDAWNKWVEQAIQKSQMRAAKINKLKEG